MKETTTGLELMEPASPESLLPQIGLWPWFAAAAVLVIVSLGLWLLMRKRKTAPDPLAARNAARGEAVAALDAAASATDARDAAVRASLILRRYLSAAARDPALFETHEEFVSRHDALNALTPEARAAASDGFGRLAALKYGPESPGTGPQEVIADSRALLETLHQGFAA